MSSVYTICTIIGWVLASMGYLAYRGGDKKGGIVVGLLGLTLANLWLLVSLLGE